MITLKADREQQLLVCGTGVAVAGEEDADLDPGNLLRHTDT